MSSTKFCLGPRVLGPDIIVSSLFRRVPEYRQVEVEVPVYEKRCCVGYRGDDCLERDEMAASTPAPLVEDRGETTCDVVDTCVSGFFISCYDELFYIFCFQISEQR